MPSYSETLCWSCRNFATGCEWSESKATVPVPGWTAEYRPLKAQNKEAKESPSYLVIVCPKYVQDAPQRVSFGMSVEVSEATERLFQSVTKKQEAARRRGTPRASTYTVTNKETGELIARGTAKELAVLLGYKCHTSIPRLAQQGKGAGKYTIARKTEEDDDCEVDIQRD